MLMCLVTRTVRLKIRLRVLALSHDSEVGLFYSHVSELHTCDFRVVADVTISRTQSRRAVINSAFRTHLVLLSEVGLLTQ